MSVKYYLYLKAQTIQKMAHFYGYRNYRETVQALDFRFLREKKDIRSKALRDKFAILLAPMINSDGADRSVYKGS